MTRMSSTELYQGTRPCSFRAGRAGSTVARPTTRHLIAKLRRQIRHRQYDAVNGLLATLEARDRYTQGHSLMVAYFARELADRYGVSPGETRTIEVAALLHDIGKVGIPDAILFKPSRLSDTEFEIMKTHSTIGAAILAPMTFLRSERRLVLHHHEWFNGHGYPAGLRGDRIPLGARVIHIADGIDAMLSSHVYRKGYSLERTLEEISVGRGKQFDPDLADLAIGWLSKNPQGVHQPAAVLA